MKGDASQRTRHQVTPVAPQPEDFALGSPIGSALRDLENPGFKHALL